MNWYCEDLVTIINEYLFIYLCSTTNLFAGVNFVDFDGKIMA